MKQKEQYQSLIYRGLMVLLVLAIAVFLYMAVPSVLPKADKLSGCGKSLMRIATPAVLPELQEAFIQSARQTNPLELRYVINQSSEQFAGTRYINGNGVWSFGYEAEPLDDLGISDFYPDAKYITSAAPRSMVLMTIYNAGDKTIINPKIRMEFTNVEIIGRAQEDFTYSGHVRGVGTYTALIWQPPMGTRIAPGDYQELTVDMSDSAVLSPENSSVTITLIADDYPAQTFDIPIILEAE